MKILVVDDIDVNRKLLRVSLRAEGHEIVEAADGVEALERLRSEKVDVVISDILMPRMDGYRFSYEVRRDPRLRDTPIVIYSSTYTSPADEHLAREAGADRFVRKPVSTSAMLEILNEVTRTPAAQKVSVQPSDELDVFKEYSEVLVRKLETSERRYRELVDSAPIGILQTTPEGGFVSANTAFARILGYASPGDVESFDFYRDVVFGPSRPADFLQRFDEPSETLEVRLKKRDGMPVWVEADGRAVKDESGETVRYEIFVRDVSARKQAEEELLQPVEKMGPSRAKVSRDLAVAVVLASAAALLVHHLLKLEEVWLDDVVAALVGLSALALVVSYRRLRSVRSDVRARENVEGALRFLRGDLEKRVEARTLELQTAVESLRAEAEVRRRAELDMRRSEQRFRRLFESNTIGIAIADLTGGILETNNAYLNMLGFTREEFAAGLFRWDDLTPAEHLGRDQIAVEELRTTGVARPWEKELLRKDGTRVPVLIGVAMLETSEQSCIAYIVDLSSRKQLEEQFRQAQKMEAVGQLAGGVAHDFNNLLTVILGFTELAAAEIPEGSALSEPLGEIRKAGERAVSLTRQLLAFSRRQVLEPRVLDLNALVADLDKMLRRLIGEDVQLATVLDPGAGRIRADAGQVEQVILNLAVNARDAMPKGGKLTIETGNVELDEAYAQEHVAIRPGPYVMLAMTDTGSGMSAATKAHMFEPFFTTKGKGKGTGLGLATVYGIVKQSEGYVWVYSELGRGTTFKVYFPLVEGSSEYAGPRPSSGRPPSGTETVLLVEDEPAVRALTRRLLERAGYSVLEAPDGQAALEIVRNRTEPIHLLLTDVVMPDMGGPDLAARVRGIRHGARVLFMSGYTDDAVVRHGILEEGVQFLQKPFTPEALARKVRETLDAPPAS